MKKPKKNRMKVVQLVKVPPTLTDNEYFRSFAETCDKLIMKYEEQLLRIENGLDKYEFRKDEIIQQNENERILMFINLLYQGSLN